MKMKHNKKRNTAFLYESLIKELTRSIVKKDNTQRKKIIENEKKVSELNSKMRELENWLKFIGLKIKIVKLQKPRLRKN